MDVRLPDGTVIANVPEGTTKADLMARVQKMPGINFQQLQAQTHNRRAIEAQIANDPISTGAQDVANEGVLPAWLAGNPGATYPERVAAAPMTRFAVGAAAPVIGGMQLLRNMGGADNAQVGPFSNPSIQQLEEMKRAGGADGFDAMGFAGNVLSPVGLGVAKTLKPAASWYGRAAQGTGIGLGFGASAPVTNGGENYWSDKAVQTGAGGAIGGGIPLALDLSVAGANALRHGYRGAIEPFFQKGRDMAEGRKYISTAGERAQEMADALRNPTSTIAGYKPTTAEIAASLPPSLSQAGREEMAGLQANVSQNYPRRIHVEQGQNKALVDAIRGFGGTQADLTAAEAERAAVTGPMRATALENANIAGVKGQQLAQRLAAESEAKINALQDMGRFQTFGAQQENLAHGGRSVGGNLSPSAYPVDFMPRIPGRYTENFQRIPEASSAVADTAEILAARKAQEGLTKYQLDSLAAHGQFPLEGRQVASKIESVMSQPGQRSSDVVTKALGEIRDKINQFSNKEGVIDSRDLYTIRKEAGNVVKKYAAENKNWDERLTSGLTSNVQKMIDDAIEGAGGSGWKDYLSTYASKSKDINQMQIGQALEGKLTNPLRGDTALNPGVFAKAAQESAAVPTKAGSPRFQTIEEALYPQNMQTVNNVSDTLANRALAADLGKAGSSRAAALTGTPDIILPPTLSHTGMALRFAARLLQGQGTSRMDQEMARDMLTNPQRVSKLMEDAMSRAKTTKEMVNVMRKYSPLATQGTVTATGEQQ